MKDRGREWFRDLLETQVFGGGFWYGGPKAAIGGSGCCRPGGLGDDKLGMDD